MISKKVMLDTTTITPAPAFSYEEAFSRNLGWVTAFEQQMLRRKRVALAGLGGVGGSHLLTLTRLGIGAFNIADFDKFELVNFNRQAGARMSSLGKPKSETLAAMARDINPTLDLKIFHEPIADDNLDAFLEGVDVYVDSLDFFVLGVRQKIYPRCRERGIPVVTAGPIGMSTGYLVFMPGGMSFEDYFRLEGLPEKKQYVNFALGLTPSLLHGSYMVDRSCVDFENKRGPSTGLSCDLCAGVAAAQVLKLLLGRGSIKAVPWYYQFDPYTNRLKQGWLPGGNANPWQRVKLFFAYRIFERMSKNALPRPPVFKREIEAILDQARWAPSGDNTQPWRFEIIDDDRLIVHLLSSSVENFFYKYSEGHMSLFVGGTLIETMRIAASQYNRTLSWSLDREVEGSYRIAITLKRDPKVMVDPLIPFIPIRSVERRTYRTTPLTKEQKHALSEALGDEFGIVWQESLAERWRTCMLNAKATDIRFRIPETYTTHRDAIDWEHDFSLFAIPARAIGLDRLTLCLTRWLMREWRRIDFMNRYAGGTLLPRLEMDIIPGLFCGAHFIVYRKGDMVVSTPESIIHAGQAIQRFWLTATAHGLVMQPSYATKFFVSYDYSKQPFTNDKRILAKAKQFCEDFAVFGKITFMGRIGTPRSRRVAARSVRQPLDALMDNSESKLSN